MEQRRNYNRNLKINYNENIAVYSSGSNIGT